MAMQTLGKIVSRIDNYVPMAGVLAALYMAFTTAGAESAAWCAAAVGWLVLNDLRYLAKRDNVPRSVSATTTSDTAWTTHSRD